MEIIDRFKGFAMLNGELLRFHKVRRRSIKGEEYGRIESNENTVGVRLSGWDTN